MIELLPNGETRQARKRTSGYRHPELNGTHYSVAKVASVYEVRGKTFAGGKLVSDQMIAAFPTEREADELARYLTEREAFTR